MKHHSHLLKVLPVLAATGALVTAMAPAGAQATESGGALFVMTNSGDPTAAAPGNQVVMYERGEDGDLSYVGAFATGPIGDPQLGSGPAPTTTLFERALGTPIPANADGLGSSNSLILNRGNRCLFAVNAGSNTVSSFRVRPDRLRLRSVVSSQGGLEARFPVSLTEHNGILYVLNSGDQGSLTGFRVRGSCNLTAIPGSSRDLDDLTDSFLSPVPVEVLTSPAQASFTPDGKRLVLSIKGGDGPDPLVPFPSGRVVVFPVGNNGLLDDPVRTEFSFVGGTGGPFSFVFADATTVIVTHANSQSVGSYRINPDHTLTLLQPGTFPTGAFAPCWLDSNGQFVYTASFGAIPVINNGLPDGNGVLNGFRINDDGSLMPLDVSVDYPSPGPVDSISGNHAIDVRVIEDSLYFVQPRAGRVGSLTIENDGALSNLKNFGGLSPGVEPFAGINPGINIFLARCFLQDPDNPDTFSPECRQGSAQGIVGF